MNIINSALMDWFHDFSSFRLVEVKPLEKMKILGYTLTIKEFIKL